jgi:excisionase family DNA binding protein
MHVPGDCIKSSIRCDSRYPRGRRVAAWTGDRMEEAVAHSREFVMNKVEAPILMRLHRVAEQLGVSQRTIRRLIARGELPGVVKVGRSACLPTEDVLRFVAKQKARR